ncbi:MAG TPA: Gfo/Idh/MocA family oxidoreductase [Stellaceae bacterium]|nr:Gfo/Idh/MocA family oxidoreductase [Stellaceae bacterium]
MTQQPVRLALIGCGGMGLRHALAALHMRRKGYSGLMLTAVCDENEAKAHELAGLIERDGSERPRVFTSTEQLFDSPGIDAVDIVLPTWLHHGIAVQALEAGKHVMVEKPLAISVEAGRLLCDAAIRSRRIVSVAENYRRIPSNRAFKALLESGELGVAQTMLMHKAASFDESYNVDGTVITAPRWYTEPAKGGSYQIHELGVHEIDLQRHWFGRIVSVTADTSIEPGPGGVGEVEATTLATLRFQSGMVSHIAFLKSKTTHERSRRLFMASEGVVESRVWHAWQDGEIVLPDGRKLPLETMTRDYLARVDTEKDRRLAPGSFEPVVYSNPNEPLTYGVGSALHDFVHAIRSGESPEIDPFDGLRTLRVCDAILRSARERRTVEISDEMSA